MASSRSMQCLFCDFAAIYHRIPRARRKFSTTATGLARHRPKYPSIKAANMGMDMKPQKKAESPNKQDKNDTNLADDEQPTLDFNSIRYKATEAELARFRSRYTPEQMSAILAAESHIKPEHTVRSPRRTDPWSLQYFDDLSHIHPTVDKAQMAPMSNIDPTMRFKTPEELRADLADLLRRLPDTNADPNDTTFRDWDANLRLTVGREESEFNPPSPISPELTRRAKPPASKGASSDRSPSSEEEASPALLRLMQMTGLSRAQIASLRVKSIISHRVVNQTRLGKISKQYFLSIAGNGHGLIGIGEAKSEEPSEARLQSQYRAIRNMVPVLRYEDRTIYGEAEEKVGGTTVHVMARPPGFGLRCQQYVWEICRACGIQDLAARVGRSRNPMNTVKATVACLVGQRAPEEIARGRGRKMVDVRKVYYAGMV